MKGTFTVILISCVFAINAQDIQWASNVIDFSSELTSVQYAAMQATGEPNVLPQGGENPNAWTPDRPNRDEYLVLGFSNPMPISQVVIGESFNPSAVTNVYLIDVREIEHQIYSFDPRRIPVELNVSEPYYHNESTSINITVYSYSNLSWVSPISGNYGSTTLNLTIKSS